jgi:protein tyrosine/serine phosphatase
MRFFFKSLFWIGLLLHSTTLVFAESTPIQLGNLKNLHKVDENLYRSEQPQTKDFKELEKLGIKTVINVRNRFSNHHELKKSSIKEVEIPINSWKINYMHLMGALKLIEASAKPVLVHCLHGSDRTGCVEACYRMVFCNWTKEDAIEEFLSPEFGYHDGWFPKMRRLLEEIDLVMLRSDMSN